MLFLQDVSRLESTVRCKYAPYSERKRAFDRLCALGVITEQLEREYREVSDAQRLDRQMIDLANQARVLVLQWIHMDVRDRRSLPPLEEWIRGQVIADVQSDNSVTITVSSITTRLMSYQVAVEQIYHVLDYSLTVKRRGETLVIDHLIRCVE